MAVWDVAARPDREQFDYWHEVICQAFVPLVPRRAGPGTGFAARVETRPLQRVVRAHIASQPQETVHGPREVARTDDAYFFVNLQVAGRCRVRQGGAESVVGPGEFTIVDTTRPYRFDFDDPWQMLSYRVPHALLDGRAAAVHKHVGGRFGGDGPGAVVRAMVASLWDVDAGPVAAAELEQALAGTLSATTSGRAGDGPPRAVLRAEIERYVRGRLGDRSLSVRTVARRFAVSPRTLHAAFADGESFAATVRRLRLDRCAALLAAPGPGPTITDIAASAGFDDAASFSRAFRREFGCTPSDVRRGARDAHPRRTRGQDGDGPAQEPGG
ncbi:helix-turn-helix domain-containing protein [Pseudonocardia petroleophila]|uniref:Helix-turn-helix domain-containing protein n=1 Tax=Pseudonocardia petroleophila TaxID=37331 RepID=A0A7G7MMU8_9PSEU|nr:helix-turn-helix domain-containing protein [Pseudonocardia petroleophila]QNG54109.1 helix-turn-helix domain-containing protein [Pseudonocardia petroleophila]